MGRWAQARKRGSSYGTGMLCPPPDISGVTVCDTGTGPDQDVSFDGPECAPCEAAAKVQIQAGVESGVYASDATVPCGSFPQTGATLEIVSNPFTLFWRARYLDGADNPVSAWCEEKSQSCDAC